MQLIDDLKSTYAATKLHWLSVRERHARVFCNDCKYALSEDCPFDYIKKHTFTQVKVCEKFEQRDV